MKHSVILIGATSLESLEAGGYFLVSKDSVQNLLNLFKVNAATQLRTRVVSERYRSRSGRGSCRGGTHHKELFVLPR